MGQSVLTASPAGTGVQPEVTVEQMPRYSLELYNGHGWLDGAEPAEFADYDAAHAFAVYSIRDLVSAEIRDGTPVELGHFIAICDDSGREMRRVPFRDAVAFADHGDPNVPIKR